MSTTYDYIILGAGAAGLSLAVRMIDNSLLVDKKLLIIDPDDKTKNDRTWCFWEKEEGYFEDIVHHRWNQLTFTDNSGSLPLVMDGYQYKMIRGLDFYTFARQKINTNPNITWRKEKVEQVKTIDGALHIELSDGTLSVNEAIVFNTIYTAPTNAEAPLQLLQHFKGWMIETTEPHFDPSTAGFMDFSVSQEEGTTFVYTLPVQENKALIEYTLFTENVLPAADYEKALKKYIEETLKIPHYKIVETEWGIIPMNNKKYSFYKDGMFHLGTAGGQTKASTGFSFQNIQERCDAIIEQLKAGKPLQNLPGRSARFHFYDSILLRLLLQRKPTGHDIFSALFRKNNASVLFKFLDEKTNLWEEIGIFKTLQIGDFLRAALKEL